MNWLYPGWLAIILVMAPLSKAKAAEQDLVAMKEVLRELTLKSSERKNCLRYNQAGITKGQRNYLQLFPTCTDFLLAGGSFQTFFSPMPAFEERYDTCFEAGFREGFVRASVAQWLPCMQELGEALSKSNQSNLEACKAKGDTTRRTLAGLAETDAMVAEDGLDFSDKDRFTKIAFFASNGFGDAVWQDVLDLGAEEQSQAFSCDLVFSMELFKEGNL